MPASRGACCGRVDGIFDLWNAGILSSKSILIVTRTSRWLTVVWLLGWCAQHLADPSGFRQLWVSGNQGQLWLRREPARKRDQSNGPPNSLNPHTGYQRFCCMRKLLKLVSEFLG